MRDDIKSYKIYISEAESLRLEMAFKRKGYSLEIINKKINNKHSVNISLEFNNGSTNWVTIDIIKNLNNSVISSCSQKITAFNDINKSSYKLIATRTEEYLVKLFIEQKNNYSKRRHILNYNYAHTYTEDEYWIYLKNLNPTNTQELLDFCFVLLLNAQDVYNIKNYKEILYSKLEFYGLNTEELINAIEKIIYTEDIYTVFYKMLLYEIIDEKNELMSVSTHMRLRRQEKIKDKVFEMYDNFIKNKNIYGQPIIYL